MPRRHVFTWLGNMKSQALFKEFQLHVFTLQEAEEEVNFAN
jgi:hypothetical protein